jgi:hypothetical protein
LLRAQAFGKKNGGARRAKAEGRGKGLRLIAELEREVLEAAPPAAKAKKKPAATKKKPGTPKQRHLAAA